MTNPLPTVGGDSGTWGTKLNNFLGVEHDATNGTHKIGTGLVTEVVNTVSDATNARSITAPTVAGIHDLTLTTNCVLTFPTAVAGQSFTLILRQNNVGGFTVTWPDTVKWASNVTPALTATAGAIDIFFFLCSDGTNWFGFVSGQDML